MTATKLSELDLLRTALTAKSAQLTARVAAYDAAIAELPPGQARTELEAFRAGILVQAELVESKRKAFDTAWQKEPKPEPKPDPIEQLDELDVSEKGTPA